MTGLASLIGISTSIALLTICLWKIDNTINNLTCEELLTIGILAALITYQMKTFEEWMKEDEKDCQLYRAEHKDE